jgi:hypothetical protein
LSAVLKEKAVQHPKIAVHEYIVVGSIKHRFDEAVETHEIPG